MRAPSPVLRRWPRDRHERNRSADPRQLLWPVKIVDAEQSALRSLVVPDLPSCDAVCADPTSRSQSCFVWRASRRRQLTPSGTLDEAMKLLHWLFAKVVYTCTFVKRCKRSRFAGFTCLKGFRVSRKISLCSSTARNVVRACNARLISLPHGPSRGHRS